jgi:hypothetical protein
VFLAEKVPPFGQGTPPERVALLRDGRLPYLLVRDLDRDGEPEVTLTMEQAGRRCCAWSRVYRFDGARGRYLATEVRWGERSDVPGLRDLDRDTRPELVGRDGRLDGLGDVRPVAVFAFARGRFARVTTRFAALVAHDADRAWAVLRARRSTGRSIRAPLSAWVADQRMLGRVSAVDRTVAGLLRAGSLDLQPEDSPPLPSAAWVRRLDRILDRLGYPTS